MRDKEHKARGGFCINTSLRLTLLVGFTFVFGVAFAAAYYWFYSFSTQMALEQIGDDLATTLHATIEGVDGDELESLVQDWEPGSSEFPDGDARYIRHQAWLKTVHDIEPRADAYTYVPGSNPREVLFVGDVHRVTEPELGVSFLEPYVSESVEGFILQGLQVETLHMDPYADKWGAWVSAYGPIKDSGGRIVGAVGIDFRADYVFRVQKAIRDSMIWAFLVTYGLLFAVIFVLSGVLTRPIVRLTESAENIAEGDFQQSLAGLGSGFLRDEIARLAEAFSVMADKVYQREQTLRLQVEDLRIEIDEARKRRHVTEIVDSDFFRDLQSKAEAMRRRRQSRHDS